MARPRKSKQDPQIVLIQKGIGKLNPDIILLQEVGSAAAFAETAGGSLGEGMGGSATRLRLCVILIGGKRVAVYCLHLKSNLGNSPMNTSKREDAMEQLVGHIKAGRESRARTRRDHRRR